MRHLHLSWITLWCIFAVSYLVAGLRKVKREEGWKGSIPPPLPPHDAFVPLKLVEVFIGNRSAFTHSSSSLSVPNSLNESDRTVNLLPQSAWTPMTGPPVKKLHEIQTSKRLLGTRPTLAALLTPPASINVFRPPTRFQEKDEEVLDTLSLPSVQNLVSGPLPSFVAVSAADSIESQPEDHEDDLVMTLYPHPSAVKKIAVMPGNMLARIPPQVLPNVNSSVSVVHSSQVIAPKQGYFPSPMGLNTPQTIAFEGVNPETTPKPISSTLLTPRHQLTSIEFLPFTAEDVLHNVPVNTVNLSTAANYLEDQEVQGSEIRVSQESGFRPMQISNAHQGPMPSFWADRLEKSANFEKDILSSGFAIDDLLRKSEDNFELRVQSVMALPLQAEDPNNNKEILLPKISREKPAFNETVTQMNSPEKEDLFSPFVDESQEEDLESKSPEEHGGVEESSTTEVVPEEKFLTNGLKSEIQEWERGEIDREIAEENQENFTEVFGTSSKERFDSGEQDNFTQEPPPWTFISTSEEKTYVTLSANEREYLQQIEAKPTTELTPTTFVGTTEFFTSTVASKFEPSFSSQTWPEIPEKVSSKSQDLVHIVVAEPGDLPKAKSKRLNDAFTKSNKLSPKGIVFTVVEGHSKVKFFGYNTLYDDSQAHYHVNKDNSFYIFPIEDSIQTLQQQKTEHTSGIRPVYFAKRPLTSLSGPFEYEQQLKKLSNNRLPPSSSAAIPDRSASSINSNTYQRLKGIRPYLNTKFIRNRIPWRM